jgi:predicted GNAT family N-acyltransferase
MLGDEYFGATEMSNPVKVIEVTDGLQMRQAWMIRRLVFIDEQHVPEEIELDADDAIAFHALALDGTVPVGCGRLVAHDGAAKIGRMAVLRERRGQGVGRSILNFLIDRARELGFSRAVLHAQLAAEGFYLKNGFLPEGEVFAEAGILHRRMSCQL